jgi:thiol-disulfide isomerase/thioredoxin
VYVPGPQFAEVRIRDLRPGQSIRDLNVPPGTAALEGSVQIPGPMEVNYSADLRRLSDPIDLPPDWNDLAVRDAWWNGPAKTPEVKAMFTTAFDHPFFQQRVAVNADGTFKLTGMNDGFWSMDITAWWKDGSGAGHTGSRTFHFTVKDGQPNVGRIEPLPLKMERSRSLAAGTAMPAIDGTYQDGRKFDWADLKGKVLFVEIWGPWCGPCKADMPGLKQLRERYKGRADFEIFSFSIDDDPAAPWQYKTEHGFDWPDVYLGSHDMGRPKAESLGVEGYPTYLLVGRDGALIEEMRLGNAIEAIERELAKH